MSEELEEMRRWVGRTEERSDIITPRLAEAYRATIFDTADPIAPGDVADPGLHWCLGTPGAPMSQLGPDGHPLKGGFLPPIPAPRRMWAGSKVGFIEPLHVGDVVDRVSTVASVDLKTGRSGRLWFVAVDHVHLTARGEAIRERQDIVYRDAATEATPVEEPTNEPGSAFDDGFSVAATTSLLFRFSALTFNTHRIHYDLPYARNVEKYHGLVVHGPLQATLLLRLAAQMRGGDIPRRFSFRGVKPLIAGGDVLCRGARTDDNAIDLWTGPSREAPFMQASAAW